VPERRWINQSQPQTLQGAVLFSYINAALAFIYTLVLGMQPFLVVFVLLAAAAFGIANEKRLAYWGGVVLACLYLLAELAAIVTGGSLGGVLNLLFAGILVVLLLHPESRHYQRIWFR
jgi:4-hydroxybenzoate polyprenyltransferase